MPPFAQPQQNRPMHATAASPVRPFRSRNKGVGGLCDRCRWTRPACRKGAFEIIAKMAELVPPIARQQVKSSPNKGYRVIAVAAGAPNALSLAGLIAFSDPPREDSAESRRHAARHGRPHGHGHGRLAGSPAQRLPRRSVSMAPFVRRNDCPRTSIPMHSAYSRAWSLSKNTSWSRLCRNAATSSACAAMA